MSVRGTSSGLRPLGAAEAAPRLGWSGWVDLEALQSTHHSTTSRATEGTDETDTTPALTLAVCLREGSEVAVKLPGFQSPEDAVAFNAVVNSVARRTGWSSHAVVMVLSYALEAAVDEVSRGGVLRLPGIGVLAAFKDERRFVVRKYGKAVMTPRFSAARGFRAQVALCAPMSSKGKQALQRHGRNNSSHAAAFCSSSRAWSAAESIRRSIRKQLGDSDPLEDERP